MTDTAVRTGSLDLSSAGRTSAMPPVHPLATKQRLLEALRASRDDVLEHVSQHPRDRIGGGA